MIAVYVYANGQRIAKMSPDGTIDYYLNDHLGSARAMAGSGWSANYYPFGGIASQTGSQEHTHFDFTGQERDHCTGLMYFGARYYDPSIGRWMSVDPLMQKYPSLSPYNYCANNPTNYFDPDGNTFVGNTPGWFTNSYNSFRQGVSNVLNEIKFGADLMPTGGSEAVKFVADVVDALIPQTAQEAVIQVELMGLGATATASASIPSTSIEGMTNSAASKGQSGSINSEEGLTTPKKFFGNKTKQEEETALEKKFGAAKSEREGAKTFYDAKNKRSYNVHHQQGHQGDKPHVDIKTRGLKNERKILLKEQKKSG